MSPQQFQRAKAVFASLLTQPPENRHQALSSACPDDPVVRAELEGMLAQYNAAGGFLNTPFPQLLGIGGPRPPLEEGVMLKGRYTVQRKLAESGFATVYLAEDQLLARKLVVLKVLDKVYSEQSLRALLETEVQALSRVRHPNVAGVLDLGEVSDCTPFLVLEYTPGLTLRQVLHEGAPTLDRVRTIVQGIGRALGAAHRAGVWHLDLKPENVILTDPGSAEERITVIDFGIAHLKDLPSVGVQGGSPRYMAPEQHERPTAKSDLFALGMVARELLAGRQLGKRSIGRALHPNPDARHASVENFVIDFLAETEERSTLPWLIGGLALLVLLGATAYRIAISRPSPPLRPVPLVTTPGFEHRPCFSADGLYVFYSAGTEGRLDIFRRPLSGGDAVPVVSHPADDDRPQCSPDGRRLAWVRRGDGSARLMAKSVNPDGPEVEIASGFFDSLEWAADNRTLIVSESDPGMPRSLRLMDAATGRSRQLLPPVANTSGDNRPAMAPDGRRLAFVRRWNNASADLFVVPLNRDFSTAADPRQLTKKGQRIESVQWAPDGRDLVYVAGPLGNGSIWRVPADGGEATSVLPGVDRVESIAISARRRKLAYSVNLSDTNIWRLDLDSNSGKVIGSQQVIAGTYDDGEGHLSPDGKYIAFGSGRSGSSQIWIAGADGAAPRQITSLEDADFTDAIWAADSTTLIVSVRSKTLGERIYQAALSGTGMQEVLQNGTAASVSRDGNWIYFRRPTAKDWQLWRASIDRKGPPDQITTAGAFFGVESPDGKWLYFTKRDESEGLWKQPLPRGPAVRVLDNLYRRSLFAPGRSGLWYIAGGPVGSGQRLCFKPYDGASLKELFRFEKDVFWGFDLAPDERSLIYSQYDVNNTDIMMVDDFR